MQLIYCLYYIFALPLRFFLFIIFLFLVLAYYFSCWEVPLAFLIKLIWWFCTLFTLVCLLNLQPKILPLSSVQFSRSVVSDSLQPHESQHARPPCPSPSPGVHSDGVHSCPSSPWYHPAISSSVIPFSSCPQSLPASVFSNESTLHMRWPKYWSFSVSIIPSKEILEIHLLKSQNKQQW